MSTALNQLYKFLGKRKKLFLENIAKAWNSEEVFYGNFKDEVLPSDILCGAFVWRNTEQGHDYWKKIFSKLLDIERY